MKRRPTQSARAAILTLIVLFVLPAQALAQTPKKTAIDDTVPTAKPGIASQIFDVVILRPFGVVVLATGAAMFVPAVIVTAPGGRDHIEGALEFFVLHPYREVFERPLGEF